MRPARRSERACLGRRSHASQTSTVKKYILRFYRAGSAWHAVLIRTPRRACTMEIIFYFCRAAAVQISTLIRPPRAQTSPGAAADLIGWHRADHTCRTDVRVLPRRPNHEICFLNMKSVIANILVLIPYSSGCTDSLATAIEVLNVKVHVFVLLHFASLPDCSQNQTAVSDTLRLLSDF
jgi:hypothetical protein